MLRRFDFYGVSINFHKTEQNENVNQDEYKILDRKQFIFKSVDDKAHHQMQSNVV